MKDEVRTTERPLMKVRKEVEGPSNKIKKTHEEVSTSFLPRFYFAVGKF